MPILRTTLDRPVQVRAHSQEWYFAYDRKYDGHVCDVVDEQAAAQLLSAGTYVRVDEGEKEPEAVPPRRDELVDPGQPERQPVNASGIPPRRNQEANPAPAIIPKAALGVPEGEADPDAAPEPTLEELYPLPEIDLEEITGIGPGFATRLENRGITLYALAELTDEEMGELSSELGFKTAPFDQGWITQAKELAAEGRKQQAEAIAEAIAASQPQ